MKRLIVFDMDGTLISGNSWSRLNKYFGVEEEALKFMNEYIKGYIGYCEFMRKTVKLWGEGVHISTIQAILRQYEFSPGAAEVVSELHRQGHTTAIITVSLDILANEVASKLGIPYVIANGLEVDKSGYLTGGCTCRVELLRKDRALRELADKLGFSLATCVAIGDSKYDRSILEAAGLGIAYKADPELKEVADVVINDLMEILKYLK